MVILGKLNREHNLKITAQMEKQEENNLLLLKKKLAELQALVQEINQSLKDIPLPKDNQSTDN